MQHIVNISVIVASLFAGFSVVVALTGRASALRAFGLWRLAVVGLALLIVARFPSYAIVPLAALFGVAGLAIGLLFVRPGPVTRRTVPRL